MGGPSKGLSSILSHSTLSSKTSLGSIIKDVKKSMPGASPSEYKKMAQTIHKLNTNPKAVVTNSMTKSVVKGLASAGHLKNQYKSNLGGAISTVKKTHLANSERSDDDKLKEPQTYGEKKAAKKAAAVHKRKMLARARWARREAEEAENTTKLGMEEWQNSKTSIGEAIKEKQRERQQQAEDDMSEMSRKAVDMMID